MMVQLPNQGKLRLQQAAAAVKVEVEEDPLEEEHGPVNKRSKVASSPFQQQWDTAAGLVPSEPVPYSLLDEPSPLGLRLRKSPSLLDLIQMRLSQGNSATTSCVSSSSGFEIGKKKDLKSTAVSGANDKLKASNFPASLLKIGSWECQSRYEGDLVGKCYFAKHKLVWEVLDGGLKSKIEIQWSDITALKANCPENGPGTLDIVLARQPLFFRETNPQPRKHTLWQATSDFTNGQASIHRRHFLQCPPGLLGKHFEKLIQCDPRLNSLSQQPEIRDLEPAYFEPRCTVFEDQGDSKCPDYRDHGYGPTMSEFQDTGSPCTAPSISTMSEVRDSVGRVPRGVPRETLSPSSVMDTRVIEENATNVTKLSKDPRRWDQIKVPGLRSSMSMSDLVNHIGHCISGQTTPRNPLLPADCIPNKDVLEELTQYLLSDSQVTSASDEQSLMSRVNSLCCLLQKDHDPFMTPNLQIDCNNTTSGGDDGSDDEQFAFERKPLLHISAGEDDSNDASSCKQPAPGISRKESFGELLMHLPRIASMPQFLYNIAEDAENQAR